MRLPPVLLRQAMRIASPQIVREAHRGLLTHAPDSESVADHSETLARDGDLAALLRQISASPEYWLDMLARHSDLVVSEVFLGMLARPADATGLAEYSRVLLATRAISAIIADIRDSDEFRQNFMQRHAKSLLEEIGRAMLGRSLAPDECAPLAAIDDIGGVGAAIAAVKSGTSFWNAQIQLHGGELLHAVYEALLGRKADESGLNAYGNLMTSVDGLKDVIRLVVQSDEYRRLSDNAPPAFGRTADVDCADDLRFIDSTFQRFRGRVASRGELAACLGRKEPLGKVLKDVLGSRIPICSGSPRVLLFGAYGNGNLGDAYQALALRAHLMREWNLDANAIFACSLIDQADYPFPAECKLPARSILDPDLVNAFDCLAIGGGGLLSHPHEPLEGSEWVKHISVPILMTGLGCGPAVTRDCATLLNRAWAVSARDLSSTAAARGLRNDIETVADPILCSAALSDLTALDLEGALVPGAIDVLWILKYPNSESDQDFLRQIKVYLDAAPAARHQILCIEPRLDKEIEAFFPGYRILYVSALSHLLAWIHAASVVVSMRYHGAIFAALAGCRFLGFSQEKIGALSSELGLPGAYATTPNELLADLASVLKFSRSWRPREADAIKTLRVRFAEYLSAFKPESLRFDI